MNRRDFLRGFVATASIAIAGPVPAAMLEPVPEGMALFKDRWYQAVINEYLDYSDNLMIFGTGALMYDDEFPFIHSIDPSTLYIDPSKAVLKGLL